jgi:hypothetical protein
MDIIRTAIVDPATDIFWNDTAVLTSDAGMKPVLVLVQAFAAANSEEIQLQKMLDACGLKQEQYNIIQINDGQMISWPSLRGKFDPKIIFMIGVIPSQLGISALFQVNMPNKFNDRVWLPTLSISELEQQPAVKKQLWMSGMKPVFVDKVFGNIESA